MPMLHDVTCVSRETLIGEIAKIKVQGYRFVTLSCAQRDEDSFDIFYHFDQNLALKNLKLSVSRNVPVPSITPVYFAAFLVENEIQDLFGIIFDGLVIDYRRTLYLEEEIQAAPFCRSKVAETRGIESTTAPATTSERISE
jgi:ech hydrogenase subunit D